MLHTISIWLAVAAFAGVGLVNAAGRAAQRDSFVRWGYPVWWCRVTGVLELAVAIMIAVPSSRSAGLLLGAAIMVAAAATVVRHREFSHLMPIGIFFALLLLVGVAS
jgi:hypothetical protein